MPLPPYPVLPSPRTWAAGDGIWTSRLDADLYNAALLLINRPLFVAAQTTTGQSIPPNTLTACQMDTEYLDNWQVHQVPDAAYPAPLAGSYLAEGSTLISGTSSGNFGAGIQAVQNGVTSTLIGNDLAANGVNDPGPGVSDLVQLNPATSDTVSLCAIQTTVSSQALSTPGTLFSAEWAGMPSTLGSTLGTVVTSPQPAALWPPGSGTAITNSGGIAAGAVSMTVASTAGMVAGGVLGLDYLDGAAFAPAAETVTITSITGTTIGISATAYPHLQNAPVAVPVSAPFLNQQARDLINYLSYPPMARLTNSGTTQAVPSQTPPAGTAVQMKSATLDSFSGWGGSGQPTRYTFPVSGTYYLYGQVFFTPAVVNVSAGLAISGGTIHWGDGIRCQQSGTATCAIVRKVMRVTAGQYAELYAQQNSGSPLAMQSTATSYSTLLALWRGF